MNVLKFHHVASLFLDLILLYVALPCAQLLKRQPGTFGRRRWSLYGRMVLRHFNELDHEILNRLNKAYIPAVKYIDLFVLPIATILARWVWRGWERCVYELW